MEGATVANQLIDHIVREGKKIMRDKHIIREKVPAYMSGRVQDYNLDVVIQGGYHIQNSIRNYQHSMRKDKQADTIAKDRISPSKAKLERNRTQNNKMSSPVKEKGQKRSYSFTGFNNKRFKNTGFTLLKSDLKGKQGQTQKDNLFIKLEQEPTKEILIERVRQRESLQEDRLRQQKARIVFCRYQQKRANQLFQKDRLQENQQKEKNFREHTSRGKDHRYYFHEGQVILYKEEQEEYTKAKLANQTNYNFKQEQDPAQHGISGMKLSSSHYFKRNHPQSMQNHSKLNEHHKIKSARGEVFASAVLKTINLSRMSMNETLRNLDDEQFMKRNDLFNNNHARQTTSIPYLQPKSGTVYTEVATNQVLGNGMRQSEGKRSYSFKSETTKSPASNRGKSHFQPYRNRHGSVEQQSERMFEDKDGEGEQLEAKERVRPIRTAEAVSKRLMERQRQRRPQTSMNKGRITKANQDLASALLL